MLKLLSHPLFSWLSPPRMSGAVFRPLLLALVVFVIAFVILLELQGCAAANPVAAAQSLEQKAFATYGSFVIVEEQAVTLTARTAATPEAVKRAIRQADSTTKPVMDALLVALQAYQATAGATAGPLTQAVEAAAAQLATLTQAVGAAKPPGASLVPSTPLPSAAPAGAVSGT